MRLLDGQIVLSPSDLSKFTRCAHATALDLGRLRGTLKPLAGPQRSLHTDLISRKGTEHEQNYIERLAAAGNRVIEIVGERKTAADLRAAATATLDAMQTGATYIYQAVFFDGDWVGYADLLERVDTPSNLGNWSYEVADTKLARSVKPHFILQLCAYSESLAILQGRAPEYMHVILGDKERSEFRVSDFAAYYRYIKKRFEKFCSASPTPSTAPYIIDFCSLCEWSLHCWRHLEQLDHLVRVANIRRPHVKSLEAAGVTTLTQLGDTPTFKVAGLRDETYAALHQQARLQSVQILTHDFHYELLLPESERGFQLLPKPSDGDGFLDVEGDPYAGTAGITYLFGLAWTEGDERRYRAWWAHNALEEKRAFEEVMDFLVARRKADHGMHVYHYGALDRAALKRMSGEYGTREHEIDTFLREEVFADLYTVVRQAVRISQPSYGLKKIEAFFFHREEEGVFEAGGPILAYEEWLEKQDPAMLTTIENYNRDDCLSTIELRGWLLRLRSEAEKQYGIPLSWRPPASSEQTQDAIDLEMQSDELSRALLVDIPEELIAATDEQNARWLLAHLIHYHRREARPAWWWYFERLKKSPEELIEDSESIGGLEPSDTVPVQVKKSTIYTFRFPAQQHKIAPGDHPVDPQTKKRITVVSVDDATGTIELKRGTASTDPLPEALIPKPDIDTKPLRQTLRRLAQSVVDHGFDGTPYRAAADILLRRPIAGSAYLFVQGPPGAGKTTYGAHEIVKLISEKKRVGVASNSHKAIHNLLDAVEKLAKESGVSFHGLKKSTGDNPESEYNSKYGFIANSPNAGEFTWAGDSLVAGTAWLFADSRVDQSLDVLFIDEAGQVSLANALAMAASARRVELLGDPLQLAQVSQGQHPGTSGASVLEHLLGNNATIPPDRGMFLEHTYRMHPDVCRFVSEVVYDGRLVSAPECANQRVEGFGTGLRFIPMQHSGNSQSSPEEGNRIADEITKLLGATVTTSKNEEHALRETDIMVVAPYNAQVRRVTEIFQRRGLSQVPVGTVDKFQGRQADVVFFSLTTSTGDDLPRDIDFLFSRNRLNVAVSRARCLAYVIASPGLLDVACNTPEQMKLVNALCRFVEMATIA